MLALPPYGAPHDDLSETWSRLSAEPGASPFSQPLAAGTTEDYEPTAATVNPYRPTYAHAPDDDTGTLQIVPCAIEEAFSPTLAIFAARWPPLVLAFVIVLVATIALLIFPAVVLMLIARSGGELYAAIGLLFAIPLGLIYSAYISVGLSRSALAVARNTPSPLMELLPPLSLVVRFLVGLVVLAMALVAIGLLFGGIVYALNESGSPVGISAVLGTLTMITATGLGMIGYVLLWAWVFVVSDGKGSALGSIRSALALTMHNKLTSILLVVIATVLSTAGTSACYVGLLVTQPLTNLMFAVAYLRMTNQSIDDPRLARQGSLPAGAARSND